MTSDWHAPQYWWLDFGAADWVEARLAYCGVLVFYDLTAAFLVLDDGWRVLCVYKNCCQS